ncbi:MAG: ABC transporter permease [Nitrospirae bacterium]|nr:ABC transporter permease [Nitrospirota bacterium]
MGRYLLRRLLTLIILLLGITLVTFAVMQLAPGGPIDLATDMSAKISPEMKDRLNKLYGFDQPWYIQYGNWLARSVQFDFGESFKDGRPVIDKILERVPNTLLLNVCTMALIFLFAIPIGAVSALRQNSLIDRGLGIFVFVGFSMPTFWFALILMLLFGIFLGWLPVSGLRSLDYGELSATGRLLDVAQHLILPVLTAAFTGLAFMSRYTRVALLEVIRQDYVRAAAAKGLSPSRVFWRHAFRNTLIPMVTLLGLMLPDLIGGAFIFETIFAYPGLGRLGMEAMMSRDYPVVMGLGTIVAFLTLLGNLLADLGLAIVDPRVRIVSS